MISKFKIPFFLVFLGSIFVIFMSVFWGINSSFFDDDINWGLYAIANENIFDCLKFNSIHGGGYLGLFLCKFLSFGLPNYWGFHPSDFICIPGCIIKGIFICITLFILTKFSSIYFKNKLNFALIYLVLAVYYILDIFFSQAAVAICNYNYYRYSFSLIFYGIFIYYIYLATTLKIKRTNWFWLIAVSLCGYIAGTSVEITFESIVILTLLIIVYNVITLLVFKSVKNNNFKKSYVFNLDKNFFIPVFFMFLGIILFVTSDKFNDVTSYRCNLVDTIPLIIKEFSIAFLNLYVIKYGLYWVTSIIIAVMTSIIAVKRNEFKKILFPLFMQISLMIAIFSLIMGTTTFYIPGQFWLSHINLKFLIAFLFLYPFLIMLSYLLKNWTRQSNKFGKLIIFSINKIILILLIIEIIILKVNSEYIFSKNSFYYNIKKSYYICEKIIRFYSLQDKIPELPAEYIEDILGANREGNASLFRPELIDKETNLYKETMYFNVYYYKIYKNQGNIPQTYQISDSAMKKFKTDGGSFTEDELNKLKFSNLFNENFVLNKNNN